MKTLVLASLAGVAASIVLFGATVTPPQVPRPFGGTSTPPQTRHLVEYALSVPETDLPPQ